MLYGVSSLAYYVCMLHGIWLMVNGVWCVVHGVLGMVYGVWCMYGVWIMLCSV